MKFIEDTNLNVKSIHEKFNEINKFCIQRENKVLYHR